MQPTPIGVPGQLCLGGDGLARGYLNRPELTAEKFIPDPFAAGVQASALPGPAQDAPKRELQPGARLYQTGDLARYLPDGNIEFLGRADHQVKIRGFRIEPGEIEAVLNRHTAVAECAVTAREDVPGEKRLVAYAAAKPDSTTNVSELRDFLKGKLPDYMVPSFFVLLDKLPLTPNGKVDRKALPAPSQSRPDLEQTYAAPRTTTEEVLAAIWSEVLGLDKVGLHDNFFELGGHSLVVMQVLSRVRDAFRVELSLRRFFEAPTIAGLGSVIEDMLVREIRELSSEEAERLAGDAELLAKERS